jgi:hypothetical protein
MNPNEANLPVNSDERLIKAVRQHQRWLRSLTALAVIFWAAAVIGGIGVIICYRVFYEPKEKQIMRDYAVFGHISRYTNSPAGGSREAGAATPEQALALHFTMNYVVTKALLIVVVTVILLSLGTLTTLLLVVLNRRVTLKQINYSLEQISRQLGELQAKQT